MQVCRMSTRMPARQNPLTDCEVGNKGSLSLYTTQQRNLCGGYSFKAGSLSDVLVYGSSLKRKGKHLAT